MLLRAGLVSLALLLLSRVLGVLRESAVAAGFGTSAQADWVVLLISLPDLLTGVVVGGALSYVLVPFWAQHPSAASIAASQARVMRALLAAAAVMGLVLALAHGAAAKLFAPGAHAVAAFDGSITIWAAALSLPLALAAALWATRLQHEQDFIGVYGANVVVNVCTIGAIFLVAANVQGTPARGTFSSTVVFWMAFGVLFAVGARLIWLRGRLTRFSTAPAGADAPGLPGARVWLAAALAAGLPLTLPFAARSLASGTGEGALARFGYAWKLVELPQMLLIQLVAMLALPAISRAFASAPGQTGKAPGAAYGWSDEARSAVSLAFALAWTLGCASLAGLAFGYEALFRLLFGWGAMAQADSRSLGQVAALGGLALPALGVIAISSAVLAAQNRLHWSALAHGVALVALLAWGVWVAGPLTDKSLSVMFVLMLLSWLVAAALWLACGAWSHRAWPWASALACVAALAVCFVVGMASSWWFFARPSTVFQLVVAAVAAIGVMASGLAAHAPLRQAVLAKLQRAR
jgi:putative peptidoglycan lipid II flippase